MNNFYTKFQEVESAMLSRGDISAQDCASLTLTNKEAEILNWINSNESSYQDNTNEIIKDSLYAPSSNKSAIYLLAVVEVIVSDFWDSKSADLMECIKNYIQNDAPPGDTTSMHLCDSIVNITDSVLNNMGSIITRLEQGHVTIQNIIQTMARQVMTYIRIDHVNKVVDASTSQTILDLSNKDSFVQNVINNMYTSEQQIVNQFTQQITNEKQAICNDIENYLTQVYQDFQNNISMYLPNSILQTCLDNFYEFLGKFSLYQRRLPEV